MDELSSGVRVQLLLSVRLAFVEQGESHCRLPILADELLANSDDQRGDAIIRALETIARTGRQVLYFTAQSDEVAKWQAAMAGSDVACHVRDLVKVRRIRSDAYERADRAYHVPPLHAVPQADGLSREEYGKRIEPPAFDPSRGVGSLHLWYLVRDARLLARLLSAGIETWGQLARALERGGAAWSDDVPAEPERTKSLARAAESICESWRIGRGTPVEASMVEACPAVTDAFRDRVLDIRAEVGGDGEEFLQRVGRLPRFRKENLRSLQELLDASGCLDDRPCLTAEEVRDRAMASVSEALREGTVTPDAIQDLVEAVCG
jgi:hypothetical protein